MMTGYHARLCPVAGTRLSGAAGTTAARRRPMATAAAYQAMAVRLVIPAQA